jgi:hypothetical protein
MKLNSQDLDKIVGEVFAVTGNSLGEDVAIVIDLFARPIGVVRGDRTVPFVRMSVFSGDMEPPVDTPDLEDLVGCEHPLMVPTVCRDALRPITVTM